MDESVQKHLTELDPTTRVLLEAADRIDRLGLCKIVAEGPDGSVCVLQAIGRSGRDEDEIRKTIARLERVVGFPAYHWNDAPERTKDEVIAKLRTIALGG